MMRFLRDWGAFLAAAGSVFVFGAQVVAADESLVALGVKMDYARGDYGTGIDSDTLTTSAIIGYYPNARLDLELTIPHIYQSSRAVTSSGNIRFGVRRTQSQPNNSPGVGQPQQSQTTGVSSQSGLGDLMLEAGYVLMVESSSVPRVRASSFIKFPTADEKKGLGTGEYDLGIGVQVSKWFNELHGYAETTFVFQGDNEVLGLKDYVSAEIGIGHLLAGRALAGLSLWGASAPTKTSSELLEARIKLSMPWSVRSGFTAYLGTGLVDESPDLTAGGSLFVNF